MPSIAGYESAIDTFDGFFAPVDGADRRGKVAAADERCEKSTTSDLEQGAQGRENNFVPLQKCQFEI